MRFTIILMLFIFLINYDLYAQNEQQNDSIQLKNKWEISLDIMSRYLWRGQSWGGNYPVVQPTIKYSITNKISVGAWATTNFKKDYFYSDGNAFKGYQELDFFVSYKVNKYFTVQLWDYYWPSVEKVEGIDNRFFNYKNNSVKTVDLIVLFDFSDVWLPFNLTLSSLLVGNDFRYDSNGENPTQNFTTYAEIGYTFENILKKTTKKTFQNIDLQPALGVVFNNQAGYYTAGDYDKPSIVNLSLKVNREFKISKRFSLPVFVNYVYNGAQKNTEIFGRNFVVLGATFCYE